ncbi:hypothetical protein [Streptosporangium sp. NPDC002721]|uniref:hypothetical protein n=1 Tax=Streptosporangium sp. NPDC002721 TaxID=3366188 RepID=UPI0036A5099B
MRRAKACGVLVRARFATGGCDRVVGYSAALRPADGRAPVWFGGGKLAADLTLPQLRQQWDDVDGQGPALAEWRRSPEAAGLAGPGERAAVDVAEWKRAAQLVDAVRERLERTPDGDVAAWRSGCRGAAAMLAALAERVEKPGPDGTGGPGPIAALADRLAWSAQALRAQARVPVPARAEVRAATRIIIAAARQGPAAATWMLVATALVLLAATIQTWHRRHRQHRQAATLSTHADALARELRRRRIAAAPAWSARRYGAFPDAHLKRLSAVLTDDVARLSTPTPAPSRAAILAFPGYRAPATAEEARRRLAAVTEEVDLRAALPAGRAAQEHTERTERAHAQQAQRSSRPKLRGGPSHGRGGRGR